MPAHRKPTNILSLVGAFDKNPQRKRSDPPTRKTIGSAPTQSEITFAQAWKYIAKCCPAGVLADRDRIYLEIAASLFVEFRSALAKMHPRKTGAPHGDAVELGHVPGRCEQGVSRTSSRTR